MCVTYRFGLQLTPSRPLPYIFLRQGAQSLSEEIVIWEPAFRGHLGVVGRLALGVSPCAVRFIHVIRSVSCAVVTSSLGGRPFSLFRGRGGLVGVL